MKRTYSLVFTLGLLLGSIHAAPQEDLFPEDVDIAAVIENIDKIPEKDLSFSEMMELGWQFAKIKAYEHPYYCIAGATVSAATLAAIIYYARNR